MPLIPTNPVVVQSDKSVLLEVENALYEEARDALARFADLEKSPEHIHTYRITPLSLWNAASAGFSAEAIVAALRRYSKYDVPPNVVADVHDYVGRYGRLKLVRHDGQLMLVSDDAPLIAEIARHKKIVPFILDQRDQRTLLVDPAMRGHLKQALVNFGFPAEDLAGYVSGAPLPIQLVSPTRSGVRLQLRHYQEEAVDVFHMGGQVRGGSGVIVLPCGAGKTIVGMGVMAKLQCATLILTPSIIAARQWIEELLDKTTLAAEDIGEYSGERKEIKPVTVASYQIVTHRQRKGAEFPHFALFNERNWGLIIYDEVHLLPAPMFRITAEIQARRRLGLTATLVREDGHESDVFSLIGPKKHDVPWKDLERQGWIATAECHEIRIAMPEADRMSYAIAEEREKYRLAAENKAKLPVIQELVAKHAADNVLVIGQYIEQLKAVAAMLDAPLVTGATPNDERARLYEQFRLGEQRLLVVSKVANFSIDLPDANVAIQISGTFGSRQEEAQRLGRILRPKRNGVLAHFYSLVTKDTRDQDFGARRQMFLTEQGYRYEILYDHEVRAHRPTTLELLPVVHERPAVRGVLVEARE